jgi:hypothetical protein
LLGVVTQQLKRARSALSPSGLFLLEGKLTVMRLSGLFLVSFLLLSACYTDPVGDYELHDVFMTAASCGGGTDEVRTQQWIEQMRAGGPSALQVARGAGAEALVREAQLRRSDDSSFALRVDEASELNLIASESLEGTTVLDSGLGADFSVLLEADSVGCFFDFDSSLEMSFEDDGFGEAVGVLLLSLEGASSVQENRCDLTQCSVEYRFGATHISSSRGELAAP